MRKFGILAVMLTALCLTSFPSYSQGTEDDEVEGYTIGNCDLSTPIMIAYTNEITDQVLSFNESNSTITCPEFKYHFAITNKSFEPETVYMGDKQENLLIFTPIMIYLSANSYLVTNCTDDGSADVLHLQPDLRL